MSADHSFNETIYRQHLDTRVLGNVVLYSDVTSTTMSLIEGSASRSFYIVDVALSDPAAASMLSMINVNKKLSYHKETMQLLHNIEIRVLH